MSKNKDRNKDRNKDKNQNNNPKQKQDPYQNQNPDNNDMRGEFGSTFDIDQLKRQKKNTNTRNKNNDLDPGKRNF